MEILHVILVVIHSRTSRKPVENGILEQGGEGTYSRQSNVGHNNGVQSAGGVSERLALVTVRVVLVLVDLAVVLTLPRHGAVANAHVALGGHGGGLLAEVPVMRKELLVICFASTCNWGIFAAGRGL